MGRIIKAKGILVASVCSVLGGILITSAPVFAAAGDGSGATGGACGKWWDTCYGATWQYYSTTSDKVVIYPASENVYNNQKVSPSNWKNGTWEITGCGQHGGYYRLALAIHNGASEDRRMNYTLPSGAVETQGQVGIYQIQRINSEGGLYAGAGTLGGTLATYRQPDIGGPGLNWDEVQKKFEIAEQHNATNGRKWGGETGWFCYNPAWDSEDSQFNSWSYISGDGIEGHQSTFPAPDSSKEINRITTEAEKVTLNFGHQLSYVHPTTPGTYASVSTSWDTVVTIDGSQQEDKRASGIWSPPTSGPATADDYSNNNLGANSVEVVISAGESKKVCSTISYKKKHIAWIETGQAGNFIVDENGSNGEGKSTICVTVERGISSSGGSEFTSQSFGSVVVDGETLRPTSAIDGILDNQNPPTETAEDSAGKAGFVSFSIEIDQESVDIDFWHLIYYAPDTVFKEKDTAPKVETKWESKIEVKTSGKRTQENKHPADSDWKTISTSSGEYSPSNTKANGTSKQLPSEERALTTVMLEKGQTALVCSTIKYEPKYITFKVKEGGDHDGEKGHTLDHQYYDYEVDERKGSGSSQACVKIYRPTEPEGTPWSGNSGGAEGDPLFAGEATRIGWNVWAQGSSTDRLTSYQAINYVTSASTNYNASLLHGTNKSYNSPCNFYGALWSSTGLCSMLSNYSGGVQSILWDERNEEQPIVSPNEVGRKHANSAGYFYEKWRCVPNPSPQGGCTWKHVGPDYWSIYNSAVRTIVKRPSVSIWNGSLFTPNSVSTSVATRYDVGLNAINVPLGSVSSTTKNFGSWTEYLEVVGGTLNGMTSGTVLSTGLSGQNFSITDNSPMTIANQDNKLGESGINSNSILRARLQDYLFSKATVQVGNYTSESLGLGENMRGTTIINIDGDLEINQDITLDFSSSSSIYTLPQVIIFASGNINIKSKVGRIDAWLVTKGELNTCSDFKGGETAANIYEAPTSVCSKSLTINGPVFAKNVILNRTYGADGFSNNDTDLAGSSDTRAATGEVFNLSADTYLWAYAQSGRYGSSYSEAYSRELPPRY